MARRATIALSLANLCFLSVWADCLSRAPSPINVYLGGLPSRADYAMVLATVLGLAALFWGTAELVRGSRRRAVRLLSEVGFWAAVAVAANNIRLQMPALALAAGLRSIGHREHLVVELAAASGVFAWWLARRPLRRAVVATLLVLSPFVLVTFAQALWAVRSPVRSRLPNPPLTGRLAAPRRPAQRVMVWLFDELDYRVAFVERPAGLALPALDRLRSEAVEATRATSPANETLLAIPSLLLGRPVLTATPGGPGELLVRLAPDEAPVPLTRQAHLFSVARSLGYDTAAVGWYHPYCRLFDHDLARCYLQQQVDTKQLIASGFSGVISTFFYSLPFTFRLFAMDAPSDMDRPPASTLPSWNGWIKRPVDHYLAILEAARAVNLDPTISFAFFHFSVPHRPYIYDADSGRFVREARSSYYDNVALVDRTVAELRRDMEQAGLWDGTAVIVTADHPWRLSPVKDPRVPLLVHMAGQHQAAACEAPVSMMAVYGLVPQMLDGRLRAPQEVVRWLAGAATTRPGP